LIAEMDDRQRLAKVHLLTYNKMHTKVIRLNFVSNLHQPFSLEIKIILFHSIFEAFKVLANKLQAGPRFFPRNVY